VEQHQTLTIVSLLNSTLIPHSNQTSAKLNASMTTRISAQTQITRVGTAATCPTPIAQEQSCAPKTIIKPQFNSNIWRVLTNKRVELKTCILSIAVRYLLGQLTSILTTFSRMTSVLTLCILLGKCRTTISCT
jgi:hypothetical protein